MNGSGEVADLMVREGIQITESAAKLAGLGAKNLAAIVIALLNEDNKLQGKTALKNLLKADKPLCILQINKQELKKFQSEAKRYGVLFTVVTDKTSESCDIIAKQDDVVKLNYIIEKLGLNAPVVANEKAEDTKDAEKGDTKDKGDKEPEKDKPADKESEKAKDKDSSSKNSRTRRNESESEKGSRATKRGETSRKPSIKGRVEAAKRRATVNNNNTRQIKPRVKAKDRG